MSDLLEKIKLSKYPSSVWLGKANGQEIIDLIEQQQKRIEELEQTLRDLGYCTDCNSILEHHLYEPFSSCNCGTSEDYATRPLQKLQFIQRQNNELSATVEQLRDALRHLHHNAKASGAEMGLALDVAEEALESTPKQNLNEVKQEAFIAGFMFSCEGFNGELYSDGWSKVVELFDTELQIRYPSGKE